MSRSGSSRLGTFVFRHITVFIALLCKLCSVPVNPCNGVTVLSSGEGSGVCCITCRSHYSRRPSCKGVGVLCCSRFGRVSVRRYNAIFYRCLIDERTILVLPGNRITILGSGEGSGVCCITGYGYNSRSPTCKGVGVLSRSRFGWVSIVRHVAVCVGLLSYNCSVVHLPRNRVGLACRTELCLVGHIARHSCYCRTPTYEGEGVLSRSGSSRLGTFVFRHITVFIALLCKLCSVPVNPCNGVTVLSSGEGSGVCCITGYGYNSRSPTCKGVGVLSCCGFSRVSVRRYNAGLNGRLVDYRSVVHLPRDRVSNYFLAVEFRQDVTCAAIHAEIVAAGGVMLQDKGLALRCEVLGNLYGLFSAGSNSEACSRFRGSDRVLSLQVEVSGITCQQDREAVCAKRCNLYAASSIFRHECIIVLKGQLVRRSDEVFAAYGSVCFVIIKDDEVLTSREGLGAQINQFVCDSTGRSHFLYIELFPLVSLFICRFRSCRYIERDRFIYLVETSDAASRWCSCFASNLG